MQEMSDIESASDDDESSSSSSDDPIEPDMTRLKRARRRAPHRRTVALPQGPPQMQFLPPFVPLVATSSPKKRKAGENAE